MVLVRENEPVVEHEHIVSSERNSGGLIIGIAMAILFLFLFFYYIFPNMGRWFSAPTVNVPGRVDVNVHQTK